MWNRKSGNRDARGLGQRRPSRRVRLVDLGGLEPLDRRILPAVTATFSLAQGTLTVFGDAQNNNITVSRDGSGKILVNNGAVKIVGGKAGVTNTKLIQIFGQAGDDNLALDESKGPLPRATIFGGDGNDTIKGGSGNDQLFGQAGNDVLLGMGGDDQLFGGEGDDVLTGGTGNDQVFGQSGNDRLIWNAGDGSDLDEAGDGNDTVEVNGGGGNDNFAVAANGTRVRVSSTGATPSNLDIGTAENLIVRGNGGDDTITAGNGLAALIQITMNGGAGNDTLIGGDGNDVLIGGDGNDMISGGRGNDTVLMGAGDDTFVWNPGDGSDTIQGQGGNDTMVFNGSNVSENFNISANGSHIRLTRNVANVTMDLVGVEGINLNTLGGADTVTLNDPAGTDLKQVSLDLSGISGTGVGDGQADSVIVNGTNAADNVNVTSSGSSYTISGLKDLVTVKGSEGANDSLFLNTLGGNDTINASGMSATVARLTVDAGDGNDSIQSGRGNETLIGGNGDDTFVWNPGDGSDTIEGQGGNDTMVFNGSNVSEDFDVSANGTRVRLFRDVANVTMDLNGIEGLDLNTLGGANTVTVNDLTGTGLSRVNVDLGNPAGSGHGDGQADSVIVNGTNAADKITVAGGVSGITVSGLAALVNITGSEPSKSSLIVNGLAGDDTINASALRPNVTALSINGGSGADLIVGSAGNDRISGGSGNDVVLMGAGDDTFVWSPGDGSDTVEGQGGNDTMIFNGSNVSEKLDVSANGSRVRLFRDVANVTMDLNGIENLTLNALGGADTVTVNDLTGTGLTNLNVDLGNPAGSGHGDGQADSVIVNGTSGDDAVIVAGDANGVSVNGLYTQVNIQGGEAANDRLTINTLGGDDVVDASSLLATALSFTANGGDGDDILLGGLGQNILNGGDGDDILISGSSQTILDGGSGDNILI